MCHFSTLKVRMHEAPHISAKSDVIQSDFTQFSTAQMQLVRQRALPTNVTLLLAIPPLTLSALQLCLLHC